MRFKKQVLALWAFFVVSLGLSMPASAHPHVWLDMKVGVIMTADGKLQALHIHWTFDEFYSAFAMDGIKKDADGRYPQKVLDDLAQVNMTNLKEVDYFTEISANGKKLALGTPFDAESSWDYKKSQLDLTFTLPLETPQASPVQFRIYDPTYYISIEYPQKGRGTEFLTGNRKGCRISVETPDVQTTWLNLPESAFTGDSATVGQGFGAHFASTATITCEQS